MTGGAPGTVTAIGGSFEAVPERHDPAPPVDRLVPAEIVAGSANDATVVVDATVAGRQFGRRSLKPRADGRWFLELTTAQRARLGADEGDRVDVDLVAAAEMPAELEAALAGRGLRPRRARRTAAARRALAKLEIGP